MTVHHVVGLKLVWQRIFVKIKESVLGAQRLEALGYLLQNRILLIIEDYDTMEK
jgi:hypothetical protein